MMLWILSALAFSGCLCLQDNHERILASLAGDFRCLPSNNQFGVIYIPPPNARTGQVSYIPDMDNRTLQCSQGYVTFPTLTGAMISNDRYPYNFAATTPDLNGFRYANTLGRTSGRGNTIHTEVLSLELLFPRMVQWYRREFRVQLRTTLTLYLFTYYLPCPNCTMTISAFLENNRNTRMFVGFTSLLGGNREMGNENRRAETYRRRSELQNLLNNRNGRLYQVGERFPPRCERNNRQGRSVPDINTCGVDDYATEIYLTMDFSTGNARVLFHGLSSDYNGWFGLYNEDDTEVTYKYTSSETHGNIDFGYQIKPDMYAVYYTTKSYSSESIRTSNWGNRCNLGWTPLNLLPRGYGQVSMSVHFHDDGYLYIYLMPNNIANWRPHSRDFVAIQSVSEFSSEQYVHWEWVSAFDNTNPNYKYKRMTTPQSSLSGGFRAKYVYYDGAYQYKGLYDNVSPFWTPEECPGARGVRT